MYSVFGWMLWDEFQLDTISIILTFLISRWCSIFWIIWWFLSNPKESLGIVRVNREYSISWQGMGILTVWCLCTGRMFFWCRVYFVIWYISQTRMKVLLDWDSKRFLKHLKTSSDTSSDKLNSEILICLFRRFLEALVKAVPENVCSTLFNYRCLIVLLHLLKKATNYFCRIVSCGYPSLRNYLSSLLLSLDMFLRAVLIFLS